MKDILTKGTAEGVRIYALCTTNLVQEAATRHHTSHLASAAFGQGDERSPAFSSYYER